jgi:EmrB/QacA subfamily drug resistance transporter
MTINESSIDEALPLGTTDPAQEWTGRRTVNGVPVHGHRPIRTGLFLTVFCLGLFMTLLDITIVNIAIPDLVTDLSTGLETVLWVTSAYSMVYAVMLITAGRLGDIHGPRQLFLIGLALFTLASLASGMSQSSGQLIAFRAVQGLGAALLAPQGLAMITSILPEAKRGSAFAAIGIMSGLGVLLGPTLGGFIVTHLDWRWIFFLNVPIGIVAFVLAIFYMPDVRPGRRHRLDLIAVALLTVGLLGVVFGLIEGQRYDWGVIAGFISIPLVIAIGCVFLGIFVWWQIRTQDREPLLPFAIFSDRTYSIMVGVLLALGFAMVGVFLPLTIYYQSVLGLTAVAAGLVIGTQSFAMMVTSGIVGGASGSGKINMKWVLFAGLLLFAGGVIYVIAVAAPDSSQWSFVPGLVASGIGLGCVWTPLFGLATANLDPGRAGVAAGVLDTLQEFGSMLATAVLGALLANRLATGLPIEAAVAAQQLPAQAQEPFVAAMTAAASGNLSVGAGQASDLSLSSGIPADVAGQIRAAADHAFAVAFTDAMRPTMLVPAIVVLLAAGAVLFVKAKGLGVAVVAAGNAAVASEGVAASEAAAVRGPAGGDAEERSVARRLPEDAS